MRFGYVHDQHRVGPPTVSATDDPYKGWYNGFSMDERRAANPLLRAARADGLIPAPSECSVCGTLQSDMTPIRMEFHLEDYRDYLRPYAICHSCHWSLHARFERPHRWLKLIAKCREDSWVQKLTMDPFSKCRAFDETYPFGITHDG